LLPYQYWVQFLLLLIDAFVVVAAKFHHNWRIEVSKFEIVLAVKVPDRIVFDLQFSRQYLTYKF
jgi:hypothetical protein